MYIGQNYHENVLRAWKEEGDITDVPKVELGATYVATDAYLINASYLNIKSVSVGYTLAKDIVKKLDIESLRIFASGENLYLFTCLKGMDPQYNFKGTNSYSYTPNRVVSMGVDINF